MIELNDDECFVVSGISSKITEGKRREIIFIGRGMSKNRFVDRIKSKTNNSKSWLNQNTYETSHVGCVKYTRLYENQIIVLSDHGDLEPFGTFLGILNESSESVFLDLIKPIKT